MHQFLFTDTDFGFCIMGQKTRNAYELVLDKQCHFANNYKYVIINVGAIDILLERDIIDIEAEYARLVKAIDMIGCKPVITTIPELRISENNPNKKTIQQTVLLFNRFLMDSFGDGYPVIDLYSSLRKINDGHENYHYHV